MLRTLCIVVTLAVTSTAQAAVVLCAKARPDGLFSSTVKVRSGSCRASEQQLDPGPLGLQGPAGPPGACECSTTSTTVATTTTTTVPTPPAESLNVPFCGMGAPQTVAAYSGLLGVTVTGTGENTPGNPLSDAFYSLTVGDPSTPIVVDPPVFRVVRASAGTCTCAGECPTSVPVSSLLAGAYPGFSASHTYSVVIDLGAGPAERLTFGFADCGCFDNSGTFNVDLRPM